MAALDPNTPAAAPPPGVIPNYHADSRAGTLITISITVTALMAVFVILRLYSRMRYTKQYASDDYTCMIAAVGSIGFTIATVLSTTAGFGRHLWDYPISTFTLSYFQRVYAVQGIYSPLILIVKTSLFLLYFRIFSQLWCTKILIYLGIGINAVFYATSFALVLYLCGPGPGHNLVQSFGDHHCVVEARILGRCQASFNIASDIYLLCIPMPVISNLQLSRKKKIGVSAIFMTGSLAVICSILNLYYRILNGHTLDFTWAIVPVYVTSVVEINVGIMCGCFPALPPVLRSVRSVLASSKLSRVRSSSTRVAKWLRLRSGDSATKTPTRPKMRVTLGSRINGRGHFFTMKSLFSQQTDETHSLDLTLRDYKPSAQSSIRVSNSHDIEPGPMNG